MIKTTYELTGLIDEGILEEVIAKATDAIKAKLTEEEQSQLRITVKGGSLDDLSRMSIPHDIQLPRVMIEDLANDV